MKVLFTVGSLVIFLGKKNAADNNWTYENLDEWPETCKNGTEQSPINIEKETAIQKTFTQIEFYNYYNDSLEIENTGHTVEFRISEDVEVSLLPNVTGGPFGSSYYVLDNFHFHWDSEHTINGSSYPLEGHFLHFKSELGNLTNSLNYINGFAVITVMYTVQNTCISNTFDDITDRIDDVATNVGVSVELQKNISIYSLLPNDTSKYFVYNGSFTTPQCNEGALWIIFEEPSCILESQLLKLSDIYTSENQSLSKNNRAVQALNDRLILYSSSKASDVVKKKDLMLCITVFYLCYHSTIFDK